MATQALITIDGVAGSDDDVPINVLLTLANTGLGGESTYLWTVLDQPSGTADALSSTTTSSCTLTPKKEGSYLVKLVVNQALPDERVDTVVVAVRQLKTRERTMAAGEELEVDGARGWMVAMESVLRRLDALTNAEFGVAVGQANGTLVRGDVVRVTDTMAIKAGLPGEEVVPVYTKALATSAANVDELLGVVESSPAGAFSVASGGLVRVRHMGLFSTTIAGAPASGAPVFVSDTGSLALSAGTATRKIGTAVSPSGGFFRVWLFGGVVD
jgi:hypothetical protein